MEKKISDVRLYDGSFARLECHDELASTADLARQYAKEGYPDRYCVLAERVPHTISDGKTLEYKNGIFLSIILRPSLFSSQATFLAPLTAVALATALDEHTTARPSIGWLSDIYSCGERIGGCTIEGRLNSNYSFEYLIVNIAVEINERNFPSLMSDLIRKVFIEENASLKQIIAKTILSKFFLVYRDIKDPHRHVEKYLEKCIIHDKKIKYLGNGKKQTCKVLRVNPDNFSLIIEDKHGHEIAVTSPSEIIIPTKFKT